VHVSWLLVFAPRDGAAKAAEGRYRETIAVDLGMRPLVAHCHLGLGKLYRRTDKREQAWEHLTLLRRRCTARWTCASGWRRRRRRWRSWHERSVGR
jgi:hypothetical protein